MGKRNSVLIIPALNPPPEVIPYVAELKTEGFERIIVVDDGSREEFKQIFDELRDVYGCDLFVHAVNMGKGRALKDSLNYYMNTYSAEYKGVITVDSDGQHLAKDVVRLDDALGGDDRSLILGVRDFDQENVPFKSSAGNRITRNVLRLLAGVHVRDTQTGLRGMPNGIIPAYLTLTGERFEYETAMLIESARKGIPIREITIETVYLDGNKESHFNALRDSVRIYSLIFKMFFKYAVVSITSFLLDYGIFCLLAAALAGMADVKRIWIATAGARVISSLYNYLMNRKVVFKSDKGVRKTMVKYYALCAVQMCCSALLVLMAVRGIHWPAAAVKPIIDIVLFLLSYRIQSRWIF